MQKAIVYWTDSEGARHHLGTSRLGAEDEEDIPPEEARKKALDHHWPRHLDAPAQVDLRPLSPSGPPETRP
jgi:hypothetical protein